MVEYRYSNYGNIDTKINYTHSWYTMHAWVSNMQVMSQSAFAIKFMA